MNKKIAAALISVFYKDGLEPVVKQLQQSGVTIYSTGGTQKFMEDLGIKVVPVESLTAYPSILGGRVKTLHPSVFGGILGRREVATDLQEMQQYNIPVIDLVIVDLYPFEETLAQATAASFTGSSEEAEKMVIEKIDIGGPSMIRAAAKNFKDVAVIASKEDYGLLVNYLQEGGGSLSIQQRKSFAAKAFEIVKAYDIAIADYFNPEKKAAITASGPQTPLRYGENPHQKAVFFGKLEDCFLQLSGKELSFNNLVDVDAAIELIKEASTLLGKSFKNNTDAAAIFAIIKHTNVCGIAARNNVFNAWQDALAGDPESAFGGVLVCNGEIDIATAEAINEIFFEVLLAPSFATAAINVLKQKKNRILLQLNNTDTTAVAYKNVVNGTLQQEKDTGNFDKWEEVGARETTATEKEDLIFANLVCKHLKSNAIALVKNNQLIGKGCGQTSRIDALRQALEKAAQFNFSLQGAVLASDAFFPFDDCVKMSHQAGIEVFIQPGGSIRDKDSILYCKENNLAMVLTGLRHFRH